MPATNRRSLGRRKGRPPKLAIDDNWVWGRVLVWGQHSADVARELGLTEASIKQAVRRVDRCFDAIQEEVLPGLRDPLVARAIYHGVLVRRLAQTLGLAPRNEDVLDSVCQVLGVLMTDFEGGLETNKPNVDQSHDNVANCDVPRTCAIE
jgi:hypothetical protein